MPAHLLHFLRNHRRLFILFCVVLFIELVKFFPLFIERYYSTYLYQYLSGLMRLGIGWLPFSLGDLLYGAVLIYLFVKTIKFVNSWRNKQLTRRLMSQKAGNAVGLLAMGYIIFQLGWGLNYNRAGSAYQLEIEPREYTVADLAQLTDTLQVRLQNIVPIVQPADSAIWVDFDALVSESVANYEKAANKYPYLRYKNISIKKMLLPAMGGYGGFTGYLNPFTGEAQVDHNVPPYARAYIMSHEMAHQLGYAAEEEANMVGYLAARQSANPAILYSVYQDLYLYAYRQLFRSDSVLAKTKWEIVPPIVKAHRRQARAYFDNYQNPAQPIIDWCYDAFLKANKQQKGLQSYSYVTAWLIAFAKKYGWENL